MTINVQKIAKLANLQIAKDDEEKFESQLSEVLDYVGKLNEVDTENIEPTSQVTGLENITREDVTKDSLTQEEALSNTKETQHGFFKVKAILDSE
jgi:aspartyl-tRNA(Asn)/glutamyl-tRNA(Gln) amidotransferase subunit C